MPGAAIAIFADRRYLACQISAIKFAGIRQVCPFPRFSTLIAANRQSTRMRYFLIFLFKMVDSSDEMEPGNKLEAPHRRDRRKKSPGLSASIGGEVALQNIRNDEHRKSRERAHLVDASEFNRRYLTCQISAISAIGENRNRCAGHTWRFLPIAAIRV